MWDGHPHIWFPDKDPKMQELRREAAAWTIQTMWRRKHRTETYKTLALRHSATLHRIAERWVGKDDISLRINYGTKHGCRTCSNCFSSPSRKYFSSAQRRAARPICRRCTSKSSPKRTNTYPKGFFKFSSKQKQWVRVHKKNLSKVESVWRQVDEIHTDMLLARREELVPRQQPIPYVREAEEQAEAILPTKLETRKDTRPHPGNMEREPPLASETAETVTEKHENDTIWRFRLTQLSVRINGYCRRR